MFSYFHNLVFKKKDAFDYDGHTKNKVKVVISSNMKNLQPFLEKI